ncbi:Pyruvate/Phosphoenolpyruvate kinase-like domain-containing protein [Aspergillus navahoensis]
MYTDEQDTAAAIQRRTSSFVEAAQSSPRPLLGALLALHDTTTAKLAARAGFDWVMIDLEHSPYTMQQISELVHAVSGASEGRCLPLIRLPSHGTEYIKWALDTGAAGIVVPMVQTPEEMESITQRALYPPRGARSFGPYHAPFGDVSTRSFAEYYAKAQRRQIAILPVLESREAVENAEAILSIDGVSGAFVGPYDLRLSYGLPGGSDGPEPEFVDAVTRICTIGKQLDKPIGSMGSTEEMACKRAAQGMSFMLVSFDYNAVAAGYRAHLEAANRGLRSV